MIFGDKMRRAFGGTMALQHSGEGWFSRTFREFPIILTTALVTAMLTAVVQYVATTKIENEKVRSAGVIKTADDFQVKFSNLMASFQKLTTATYKEKQIPEQERADLSTATLIMQLLMSPATGRWPDNVYPQVHQFFTDLAEFDNTVRNARAINDLAEVEQTVRRLVTDDMEITRAMQKEAQIH